MRALTAATATAADAGTCADMTPRQRHDLDDWKAGQLAKAPAMDEATARRVSAALFGTHAPARREGQRERKAA